MGRIPDPSKLSEGCGHARLPITCYSFPYYLLGCVFDVRENHNSYKVGNYLHPLHLKGIDHIEISS